MATPPRVPPRFVPTLTEVVRGPAPEGLPQRLLPEEGAAPLPPAPVAPSPAVPGQPRPPGVEEYVVHRVMQRGDVILERRLREAIALVIEEQTRSVVPRLREEVESVVRHAVYEAVAEELSTGRESR